MNLASLEPKPAWLKVRIPDPRGPKFQHIQDLLKAHNLHTVCEEARCPNVAECWAGGTATFMVLGDTCSRGCRFCSVPSAAKLPPPDPEEPRRLAGALAGLRLDYAVITAVCRDDLPDQGAGHIANCIREIRSLCPQMLLEVLIPDFRGEEAPLELVLKAGPHVLSHNLETVERLTPGVRDARAGYRLSLEVLRTAKKIEPRLRTKSGLMLGLGETEAETAQSLRDLHDAGVEIVTLWQYLRPSRSARHLPVADYLPPERFARYQEIAESLGFLYVAAGPLVRSSYRAGELFLQGLLKTNAR